MTLTKLTEYIELFREFVPAYLLSFRGERRARLVAEATQAARSNFDAIREASLGGRDVTTSVLLKLLPHADTPRNRQMEAWIHFAPVIADDVREWFESAGWIHPIEWEPAAREVLRLIERCVDHPTEAPELCRAFASLPFGEGFQSAMISPILHALRPEEFALVNNRTRWTLNYFLDENLPHTLTDYPEVNRTALAAIRQLAPDMQSISHNSRLAPDELFELFAHWLVAVKGYFKKPIPDSRDEHEPVVGIDRASRNDAREAIERLYPDPIVRRRCLRFLADAIRHAHRQSPSSWEISLFRDRLRLNVGRTEVMALYPREVYLVIDADVIDAGERELLEDVFEIADEWYENIPGTKGWGRIPASQLGEYLHLVGQPHRRLIAKAAATTGAAAWPEHHSQGVIDYLREILKRRVPTPAHYQSTPEPTVESRSENSSRLEPLATAAAPEETVGEPNTRYRRPTAPAIPPSKAYSVEECEAETGIERSTLRRWIQAIERKGQAIIHGPPGTGKTYLAQRLARLLCSGGDGFVQIVQFHPAYSYEDFVIGIRPRARDDGSLEYPMVPGRFLRFCEEAARHSDRCVLIVDEINRANLARVFGELMYLLEYRTHEIPLAGGIPFAIPANVRIIGTMNSADRSIALVDHALRRRFAMIELRPDYEALRRFHIRNSEGFDPEGLIRTLRRINETIGDPRYQIGISYFLRNDLPDHIEDIWIMEIEPYLDEYFFDQPARADSFRWAAVRESMLP